MAAVISNVIRNRQRHHRWHEPFGRIALPFTQRLARSGEDRDAHRIEPLFEREEQRAVTARMLRDRLAEERERPLGRARVLGRIEQVDRRCSARAATPLPDGVAPSKPVLATGVRAIMVVRREEEAAARRSSKRASSASAARARMRDRPCASGLQHLRASASEQERVVVEIGGEVRVPGLCTLRRAGRRASTCRGRNRAARGADASSGAPSARAARASRRSSARSRPSGSCRRARADTRCSRAASSLRAPSPAVARSAVSSRALGDLASSGRDEQMPGLAFEIRRAIEPVALRDQRNSLGVEQRAHLVRRPRRRTCPPRPRCRRRASE